MHKSFKFFVSLFFFVLAFTPMSTRAATWTTGTTLASAWGAGVLMYNTYRSEFAFGYASGDAYTFNFTTSSAASSWSTATTITSQASADLVQNPMLSGVSGSGIYLASISAASGSIWGISPGGGSSWTTSTNIGIDKQYGSADLTYFNSARYIGGTVSGPGLSSNTYWMTSSTNGTTFTSSTILSNVGVQQQGRLTSSATLMAAVYTTNGDTSHLYVATSTNGTTFSNTTITVTGASAIYEPRIAIDSSDRIWVSYFATVGGINYVYVSTMKPSDSESCGIVTEQVDLEGAQSPVGLGLTIINGTTPVISYNYSETFGVLILKSAVRNGGDSSCGGSATKWSCSTLASGLSGNRAVYSASNGAGRVVVAYLNGSSYESATADFGSTSYPYSCVASSSSSSSSQGLSLKTLISPIFLTSNALRINNGEGVTSDPYVTLYFHVSNASEVAYSLNSELMGSIWESYSATKKLTLPKSVGDYTVYAKFTNPTGAVSDITSSTIRYEVPVPAPAPVEPSAPEAPKQVATPIVITPPAPVSTGPQELGTVPFISEEDLVNLINSDLSASTAPLYGCPERPNAFSIGGEVVRERKTQKSFVLFKSLNVACPVVSSTVLTSWGSPRVALIDSIGSMRISTPLPYRPGTILRTEKGVRYFTNTRGQLHKVPSPAQFAKLKYNSRLTLSDTAVHIQEFPMSADLIMSNIHPDGTLFVINKAKGLYALLHNRVLHEMDLKTLKFYRERPERAIPFAPGESYPTAESWSRQ
jgi:hypothetical protein